MLAWVYWTTVVVVSAFVRSGECCGFKNLTNIRLVAIHPFLFGKLEWDFPMECSSSDFIFSINNLVQVIARGPTRLIWVHLPDTCQPVKIAVKVFTRWIPQGSVETVIDVSPPPAHPWINSIVPFPEHQRLRIDWVDSSQCKRNRYLVNVYNKEDHIVLNQSVNMSGIELVGLDQCIKLLAEVTTISSSGKEAKSGRHLLPYPLPPSAPQTIKMEITPFVSNITVSWTYNNICGGENFMATIYHANGSQLVFENVTATTTTFAKIPLCTPIYVGVLAINKLDLVGPEVRSEAVTIPAAPGKPSKLQVETHPRVPHAIVSWTQETACKANQFLITAFTLNETFVASLVTSTWKVLLRDLPMCVPMVVSVVGMNEVGTSLRSITDAFAIWTVPSMLESITVRTNMYSPGAIVSWEYDGQCSVIGYRVTLKNAHGDRLDFKTSQEINTVDFEEVPKCVSLIAEVVAVNTFGSGPATNSGVFTIPAAPIRIDVKTIANEANLNVSWMYATACDVEGSAVTVYDALETPLKTLFTSGETTVAFNDLPLCVPLTVGVLGRNKALYGQQRISSEFIIPGTPDTASDLELQFDANRTQVNVSWTAIKNACGSLEFTITLYNGSEKVHQEQTTKRFIHFEVTNNTNTYRVGIVVTNGIGKSPEVYSETFFKTAPEPPREIFVEVSADKKRVKASWSHGDAVNFTVSIYKENNKITIQRTIDLKITLGSLPADLPLRFGVQAHNQHGTSLEALSTEFHLPSANSSLGPNIAETKQNPASRLFEKLSKTIGSLIAKPIGL